MSIDDNIIGFNLRSKEPVTIDNSGNFVTYREVAPIYTIHPDEIVAAQPMTAPASLMFYMDFKYPNPPNYKDRWEWIWEEINAEED